MSWKAGSAYTDPEPESLPSLSAPKYCEVQQLTRFATSLVLRLSQLSKMIAIISSLVVPMMSVSRICELRELTTLSRKVGLAQIEFPICRNLNQQHRREALISQASL